MLLKDMDTPYFWNVFDFLKRHPLKGELRPTWMLCPRCGSSLRTRTEIRRAEWFYYDRATIYECPKDGYLYIDASRFLQL